MKGEIILVVIILLGNVLSYATKEGTDDDNWINDLIYPITLILLCGMMYLIGFYDSNKKTSKKPITPTITVVCKDNLCDTTYNYNQNK
jgi:hypothetical protein